MDQNILFVKYTSRLANKLVINESSFMFSQTCLDAIVSNADSLAFITDMMSLLPIGIAEG